MKTFKSLDWVLQFILLLLPMCNWIVEIIIRWSEYLKKNDSTNLVIAILTIPFGVFIGWVDCVGVLLNREPWLS